jgi:hypothetical protein
VERVLFVLAVDEAAALLVVRLVVALVDALLACLVLRHVVDRPRYIVTLSRAPLNSVTMYFLDASALVGIAVGLVAAHAEHVPMALVETLLVRPST